LKQISESSFGKMIGNTVQTVGTLALQNAPTLLNMASNFVPMGSMTSKVLGVATNFLGGEGGQQLTAGILGGMPQEAPQTSYGPITTGIPQYPPGHPLGPATPEQIQAVMAIPTRTWRVISDKLAMEIGKSVDEMWKMVLDKFKTKGIYLSPL
jgi:hypothetical protein